MILSVVSIQRARVSCVYARTTSVLQAVLPHSHNSGGGGERSGRVIDGGAVFNRKGPRAIGREREKGNGENYQHRWSNEGSSNLHTAQQTLFF